MASPSLALFSISVFLSLKASVFHLLCFSGKASDVLLFADRKSSFQIKPKLKIHLCLEQKEDSFFMNHKTFFLTLACQRFYYLAPCLPILTSLTSKSSTNRIKNDVRSFKGMVRATKFIENNSTHHNIIFLR